MAAGAPISIAYSPPLYPFLDGKKDETLNPYLDKIRKLSECLLDRLEKAHAYHKETTCYALLELRCVWVKAPPEKESLVHDFVFGLRLPFGEHFKDAIREDVAARAPLAHYTEEAFEIWASTHYQLNWKQIGIVGLKETFATRKEILVSEFSKLIRESPDPIFSPKFSIFGYLEPYDYSEEPLTTLEEPIISLLSEKKSLEWCRRLH